MDIEYAVLMASNGTGAQNAHPAGHGDEVGPINFNAVHELAFENCPFHERRVVDYLCRNAGAARALKCIGIWAIANNGADAARNLAAVLCVDQGLKITAAAGDQNDDRWRDAVRHVATRI
jgi:hypothetical protein